MMVTSCPRVACPSQELYELRKYITENKKLRRELEEEREESSALRRRLAAAEKALAQVGP